MTKNDKPDLPRLLSIQQAARYLGVSIATLRRMDREGVLAPLRTAGGHRRYTRELLEGYIAVKATDGSALFDSDAPSVQQCVAELEKQKADLCLQLEKERQQRQTLTALNQAAAIISQSLDLSQILTLLLDQLEKLVPYDSSTIQLLENDTLQVVAMRGFPPGVTRRDITWQDAKHPMWRTILTNRAPLIISDTQTDPRWMRLPKLEYICSWIGVPIVARDWIWGILTLDKAEANFYRQEHADLAAAVARYAAAAIENAQLYASAYHLGQAHQTRVAQLASLQTTSLKLSSTFELDKVLETLAEGALELTPAADAHIYFYNPDTEEFSFGTALWRDGRREPAVISPRPDGLTATVARYGKSLLIDDAPNHPLFSDRVSSQWGVHAVAGFPLKRHERVIGVFNMTYLAPHHFTPDEVRILTLLADQATVAIENAQLYQKIQQYSKHLESEVEARTRQLRQEKERAEVILTHAGDGIVLTDASGAIEYVNPSWEWQNGYTTQQVLGKNPSLLKSGETPPETYAELWGAITEGRVWRGHLRNRRADGSVYDCDLIIAPVMNGEGEIVNFVGVQRDITRLKEVERLKDAFVSNVSHELRTPITNLKLYQNLLQRGAPEKRETYLQVIARETARLEQLVSDLLDLSRLDRGVATLSLEWLDLNALVNDVVNGLSKLAEQRHITLELTRAPGLPPIRVDTQKIFQALTNLVVNALNYTPAGGQVLVETSQTTHQGRPGLSVAVRDTGIGIASTELERVFERFYRGKAARDRNVPGTGLGLPIAQEIVSLHNGHIQAQSQIKQGSTFTVWLPLS